MSQTAIGKAALVLTTDASQAKAGLAQFGRDARKSTSDTARGMEGGLGGLKLAGAAAVAAGGVLLVKEAIQELDEVAAAGAAAKAFGLTAEQFTGMAGVAKSTGEGQREFIESLVTLGKVASEGAAGKGEVATAWFKSLNLDAAQFKQMRLDDQFFAVFEAIQKIPDPAERVRALMVAFGEDGGKYLLPLLSKAPAELRRMAGGFAISTAEVERATTANQSVKAAQAQLGAVWRKLAVALAPVIGKVAEAIQNIARVGAPVFDWFGRAVDAVVEIWQAIAGEVQKAIDWIVKGIGGWIDELGGLGLSTLSIRDVIIMAFRMVGTTVALVWDTLKVGVGAVSYVFGQLLLVIADVGKALIDLAKAMPESLRPGWVNDLISGAEQVNDGIRGTGRTMSDFGKNAVANWGQSAVQFNQWLDKVTSQQKAAAAETARDVRDVAAAVAQAEEAKASAGHQNLDNAALIRGSTAEVSARLKYEMGGKLQEQQLAEQKKGNGFLRGILTEVKGKAAAAGLSLKPL